MPKKEKHTAEFKLRVEEVADCIQDGMRSKDIEAYIEKRYEVAARMVRIYLKGAKEVLSKREAIEGNDDIKKAKERAIKRRLEIFDEAWKDKDWKICLQAEDSIAKIQGIFTPVIPTSLPGNKDDTLPYVQVIGNMSISALKQFIKTGNIPGFKGVRMEQEEGFEEKENKDSKKTLH